MFEIHSKNIIRFIQWKNQPQTLFAYPCLSQKLWKKTTKNFLFLFCVLHLFTFVYCAISSFYKNQNLFVLISYIDQYLQQYKWLEFPGKVRFSTVIIIWSIICLFWKIAPQMLKKKHVLVKEFTFSTVLLYLFVIVVSFLRLLFLFDHKYTIKCKKLFQG